MRSTTVYSVSSTALLHSVPLLIIAAVFALVYLVDRRSHKEPVRYHLGEKWTHDPILWTSEDMPVSSGQVTAGVEGGSASGSW